MIHKPTENLVLRMLHLKVEMPLSLKSESAELKPEPASLSRGLLICLCSQFCCNLIPGYNDVFGVIAFMHV